MTSYPYYQNYQSPPIFYYTGSQLQQKSRRLESATVYCAQKKLQNFNCIEEPTNEEGGLYLGDIICLIKPEIIKNNKIEAILTCMCETNYPICIPSSIIRKTLLAKDNLEYQIGIHFEESYKFIEQMRLMKKNVLIHCHAGISRSATILCSYLMKKKKWGLQKALNFLKSKRNRVKPNENFLKILRDFEKQMFVERQNIYGLQQLKLLNFKSKDPIQIKDKINSERKFLRRNLSQLYKKEQRTSEQNNPALKQENLQTNNRTQLKQRLSHGDTVLRFAQSSKSYRMESKKCQQEQNEKQNKKINLGQEIKKEKKVLREEPKFGDKFKNKVSSALGRKTRIPWQLTLKSNKNIELSNENISLNCF